LTHGSPTSPQTSLQLYRRLLRYVAPYRVVFALGLIGMAAAALTEPLFPALMKPMLNDGFGGRDRASLTWIPLALIGIFLLRGVITFTTSYTMAWVSNRILMDMRDAMFARLIRLPTAFYNNQSSGTLISRIAFDVNNVTSAATTVLTILVRDSITVLGLFAWLLYENWRLTLVALAIIPLSALVIRLFSRRLRTMSREAQRAMGDITHVLGESIDAHKVVKVYGGEKYENERFHKANAMLRGFNMRQTIAAAATVPITQLFAAIAWWWPSPCCSRPTTRPPSAASSPSSPPCSCCWRRSSTWRTSMRRCSAAWRPPNQYSPCSTKPRRTTAAP